MIFQIILVIITLAIILSSWSTNRRTARILKDIKGFPTIPIIGNVHQLGTDTAGIFNNLNKLWAQANYGIFKLMLGWNTLIFITEPDAAESVLGSTSEIVKPREYDYLRSFLGNGLFTSAGMEWRKNRRLLTPAFHFKILEQFIHIFNRNSKNAIDHFSKNLNKPIDVYHIFSLLTLDMIVESALGTNINSLKCSDSDKSNPAMEYPNAIYRMTKNYKDEIACVDVLNSFGRKIIQERKLALKDQTNGKIMSNLDQGGYEFSHDEFGQKEKLSFLDLLLLTKNEDGTPLDDQIILDEVNSIIAAGHETVTSLLSFFVYMLSKHPEVQKKVFDEQYSIFGDDKMKDVTSSDCTNMKYMEMVIKETLRILPSAPMIGRKLQKDLILKDGRVLPAGITLVISIYALGNNPKYVKNPEVFDPERFSFENSKKKHPFSFVPFSAGPRNCIGQRLSMFEAKVVLSKLIRNYKFYNQGIEDHTLQLCGEVTMKSRTGVVVKIKQR